MSHPPGTRFARRTLVKLIAAAASAPALLSACTDTTPVGRASTRHPPSRGPSGTLSDPDLIHPVVPWQLTLDDAQLDTLRSLCDLILPADDHSPAASSLGAHDFIDEWISAPFEPMQADAKLIRHGLAWLDEEATRRFAARFHALSVAQQTAMCEPISHLPRAPAGLEQAAQFFDRVRELTAIAYYTTRTGMADLGYVGNVALAEWKAPPPEVLRLVGLE